MHLHCSSHVAGHVGGQKMLTGVFSHIDPFTQRHKVVYNGEFLKFEAPYSDQKTAKSIKIH